MKKAYIKALQKNGIIFDQEVVNLGYDLFFQYLLECVIIIVISIITNQVLFAFLYISMFSWLRPYVGGYHAKTVLKCGTTFILLFIIGSIISNLGTFNLHFVVYLAMTVYIFLFAPIEHPNNVLSKEKYIEYKNIVYKKLIMLNAAFIIASTIGFKSAIGFMVVFNIIGILAIIQQILNRKGGLL